MKNTLWIVAFLLLISARGLLASETTGMEISHEEPLRYVSAGRDQSVWQGEAGARSVAFDALGRRFALELESNERLISRALDGRLPDGIGVYRGSLEGMPGSWVRLVVSNGVPGGLIWDGQEMLAVEARSDASGKPTAVIYRLQDVYVEPGTMTCGSAGHVTSFATVYEGLQTELQAIVAHAAGAVEELNIGVVADYELTQRMGANTEAEILTRINNVDGIFSEQLGVQITPREVETFSASNDPFTKSVGGELLVEVSAYRRNTPAQAEQGITYLFTGRDLDGSSVGVAYVGALCSTSYGVGLGEARRGVTTDSLIAAHEIGHIFGAEHDGEADSVCKSVTGTFLMSPSVGSTNEFSSCSIDTMRPFVDGARCINPLPEADVSLALASAAPNLLLGDSAVLEFDVVNNGTLEATNVSASFDVPTNLALGLVSTTSGSCTSGAGQVDCELGTIAGSATARVSIAVTADAVGSGTLVASVTADADTNPGNDGQLVPVNVSPATDLLVRSAAAASVTVDNAVTIRPTVENLSSVGATSVALTVAFSDGLRVESASWPDGTCTVGASTVECQRASLAAGSQVAIDVRLTALSTGSQSYTATVASSEVDPDESNNSATGTVTVTAVSSTSGGNESDSGGGAVNLVWLLFAVFLRLRLVRG